MWYNRKTPRIGGARRDKEKGALIGASHLELRIVVQLNLTKNGFIQPLPQFINLLGVSVVPLNIQQVLTTLVIQTSKFLFHCYNIHHVTYLSLLCFIFPVIIL